VAKEPGSGEGLFAVRSCEPNNAFVVGQLPQTTPLYLLGTDASQTCRAFATKITTEDLEAGHHFSFTGLRIGKCPNNSWRLAYIHGEKPPRYKLIKNHSIPSVVESQEVERQIRLRAQDFEKDDGEHPIKLSLGPPRIFSLPSQAKNVYLVSFDNLSGAKDPTFFFFSQGRIELIHGAAKLVSTFTLSDETYGHFQFSCRVGCGWHGDFVVQFSETTFHVVMFEDAGST